MCEPFTIGMIAVGAASAVGSGFQIAAGLQAADAQEEQAENNALLAKWQASDAIQTGAEQGAQLRSQGAALSSSAVAQLSASGVSTTEGTAGDVPGLALIDAERNARITESNNIRAAWGFTESAKAGLTQAELAGDAATLGAIGMGLGAGASLAFKGMAIDELTGGKLSGPIIGLFSFGSGVRDASLTTMGAGSLIGTGRGPTGEFGFF